MTTTSTFKHRFVYFVSLLFIALFTYAAVSKLLDFENFKVQLGQSPLLSSFANWVSVGIPGFELVIAALLLLPKSRLQGLYASYLLMTMFTLYIYIILNYSAFVPCSCGGILQKMTWQQHLVFNIVFILLALIAVLLYPVKDTFRNSQHAAS